MPANIRVGTPTNLTEDGTYDILLFTFDSGFPEGKIKLSFGNTPRKITGVQKVAQVFAKLLMTPTGSDPIYQDYGTDFTDYLTGSNLGRRNSNVSAIIDQAVRSAESQSRSLMAGGADMDSQLRSATLVDYDVTEDAVTMYIRIVTEAGEEAALAVPFPQTDLEVNI